MCHAPEDIMCYAVQGSNPLWINTFVTPQDIRRVFRRSPCLTCVLAKRRKEGMRQWKRKRKRLRLRKNSDVKRKPSTTEEMDNQDEHDAQKYKPGEVLSCDNVGPINPMAINGATQVFIWRDTATKMMFCHTAKDAGEDEYIKGLEAVRTYYKSIGIRIGTIRTDDFTTFKSAKVIRYYVRHRIKRQSSTPYQHWQNSVERDMVRYSYVQTAGTKR